MSKHSADAHRHTKGETDPAKILAETQRIQRENQAAMDQIKQTGSSK
jgi:hypothetical protein